MKFFSIAGPFVFHTFEWEDEFHPKESDDEDDGDDDEDDEDDENRDEEDGLRRGATAASTARNKNRMPVPSRVKPKGDSRSESPSSIHNAASGRENCLLFSVTNIY